MYILLYKLLFVYKSKEIEGKAVKLDEIISAAFSQFRASTCSPNANSPPTYV
jgi:hypothetical protein